MFARYHKPSKSPCIWLQWIWKLCTAWETVSTLVSRIWPQHQQPSHDQPAINCIWLDAKLGHKHIRRRCFHTYLQPIKALIHISAIQTAHTSERGHQQHGASREKGFICPATLHGGDFKHKQFQMQYKLRSGLIFFNQLHQVKTTVQSELKNISVDTGHRNASERLCRYHADIFQRYKYMYVCDYLTH